MRLSDGTILMHEAAPYDPVKAHEYYIKTRQLKGRRPAASVLSRPIPRAKKPPVNKPPTFTVAVGGRKIQLTQQQLHEQQAYAAKRVGDIKVRLAELGVKLKQAMIDANKAPTAADKSKAARKSRQYRQSHKQQIANKAKATRAKRSVTKKDHVVEIKNKINQVKGRLEAAVQVQRALAGASKSAG